MKFENQQNQENQFIFKFLSHFKFKDEFITIFFNENWRKKQPLKEINKIVEIYQTINSLSEKFKTLESSFSNHFSQLFEIFINFPNDEKFIIFLNSTKCRRSLEKFLKQKREQMKKFLYKTTPFKSFEKLIDLAISSISKEKDKEIEIDYQEVEKFLSKFSSFKMKKISTEQKILNNLALIFGKESSNYHFIYSSNEKFGFLYQNEKQKQEKSLNFKDFLEINIFYDNIISKKEYKKELEIFKTNFSKIEKIAEISIKLKNLHFVQIPKDSSKKHKSSLTDFQSKLDNFEKELSLNLSEWEKIIKFPQSFQISFFSQEQFSSIIEGYFSKKKEDESNSLSLLSSFYPNFNPKKFGKLFTSSSKKETNLTKLKNFTQNISKLSIKDSIKKRTKEISIPSAKIIKKDMPKKNKKITQILEGNKEIQPLNISFCKIPKEKKVYKIVTSLYFVYCNHFPLKENVLICNQENTMINDIEKFFSIYQIYNQNYEENDDKQKYIFTIIHSHKLNPECLNFLNKKIQEISYKIHFPLVIFYYENYIGSFRIINHFQKSLISYKDFVIPQNFIDHIIFKTKLHENLQIFSSDFPGMGKSYQIYKKFIDLKKNSKENSKKNSKKNLKKKFSYHNFVISNGTTKEFIDTIYSIINSHKNHFKFIHIELPFSIKLETLDYLWTLSMWGSIESKRKLSQNFNWIFDSSSYFLALEVSSKKETKISSQFDHFPLLYFFERNEMEVDSQIFSLNKYHLNNFNIEEKKDEKWKSIESFFNSFKDYLQDSDITKSDKKLFKLKLFNFLKNKISEKLVDENLTFRLFSNLIVILKSQNELLSNFINIIKSGKQQEQKLFIESLLKVYFSSIIDIISSFLHWNQKEEEYNYSNESEHFWKILSNKIKWNDKQLSIPLFLQNNDSKNEKLRTLFISNINLQSIFDSKVIKKINDQNLITFYEISQDLVDIFLKEVSNIFLSFNPTNSQLLNIFSNFPEKFNNGEYPFFIQESNIIKMIYIIFKLSLNIPVIFIDGDEVETKLIIQYLLKNIFNQKLIIYYVNSQTTQEDIIEVIEKAKQFIKKDSKPTINIWFHNFNCSSKECIILFKKILLDRVIQQESIPENIHFLASFKSAFSSNIPQDQNNNNNLISLPQIIPESFFQDLYDFGNSPSLDELKIIQAILLQNISKPIPEFIFLHYQIQELSQIIFYSRKHIKKHSTFPNEYFESYQDVSIFTRVFQWLICNPIGEIFITNENTLSEKVYLTFSLCFFLVYFYYLDGKKRDSLLSKMNRKIKLFNIEENFNTIITNLFNFLEIDLSKNDIVKNKILKENILFILVSCFSQIPLLIIGKPGTSKTISLEIIFDLFKFNPNQKPKLQKMKIPYLKKIEIISSELISKEYLQKKFQDGMKNLQKNQRDVIPVFIFKEFTNLSNESLKVLYSQIQTILNEKYNFPNENLLPFPSIILLSNSFVDFPFCGFVLNHQYFNFKEFELTIEELLIQFSDEISGFLKEQISYIFSNQEKIISKQFPQIIQNQKLETNFYDVRDVYAFIRDFKSIYSESDESAYLFNGYKLLIFKHFGITQESFPEFFENLPFKIPRKEKKINFEELISENLKPKKEKQNRLESAKSLRHILLSIQDASFFTILYDKFFHDNSTVISSSKIFSTLKKSKEDELKEKLMIVEFCITNGKKLIIFDYPEIYPFLYKLFNQNYIQKDGDILVTISFGEESRKIIINPNFRLFVITTNGINYEFSNSAIRNHFGKYNIDDSFFEIKKSKTN
ncbi:e3 ubiquitin-protein ligase rnf213 [Anaeramoeba ignava]|uniref:E3 ubiquitin-protein ligase rnf213 n=1 Tax=Anaeramoeba ignava TaxID=1746090 RepID=A0A9Q0LR71_ANAIG|nr:e3 ubiquitin-protein ligase rnf213 [Anaeramoeba ignava]